MKQVTKETLLVDLFSIDLDIAIQVLEGIGMYCLGCSFSEMETIEQAAKSHFVDVDDLVQELNERLNESISSKK